MSVMSKVFYQCTRNVSCKDIVHPWTDSCWELRRELFLSAIPGNLKFFLPFIIVRKNLSLHCGTCKDFYIEINLQIPAMLKVKSFGYQLIKDSLLHYLLVFTNGMFIANSIIFGACMWRCVNFCNSFEFI